MITKEIVDSYKEYFNDYVNQFIESHKDLAENIEIKADHSRKVSNEIVGLARNLNLSEEDILLAEIIGLYHDIGRFKQYVKYQTFSDSKSQNHAELGVEVLKENKMLKDLSVQDQEIIYKAILNHNRAEIIPDQDERVIFYSELIRDADKLDIWRVITEYYMVKEQKENKSLELELPDTPEISNDVFNAIINQKVVLKETMKSLNDFKLLQIAWVFDLNFSYSVRRLYEKKYLDKIFNTLPDNEKVNHIKQIVKEYFNDHMNVVEKSLSH